MKKQLALEFIYKTKMIDIKLNFANLGTLYRLIKRPLSKQIFISSKRKGYPEVFLDQDGCRVNFAVSVNLAKNLLVKF